MNGKLVCGVGIYTKGKHKASDNGRSTKVYDAWRHMLMRCYDSSTLSRDPTYASCTVCDEWLDFQAFAEWYDKNYPRDGEVYQLDKDLKVIGNKVYSPKTCLFTLGVVNTFTVDRGAARGDYMIGVNWWDKRCEKFRSCCRNPFTKKQESLGYFTDELSAHLAWRKRKSELAYQLAMKQSNPEVRDALLRWKSALDNNEIHAV